MATHQVLIGQPGELLLDAEFHLGLRGEQQCLAEGLLLLVQLLLQGLHLGLETLHLLLMLAALGLQLCLQQPAPGRRGQVTERLESVPPGGAGAQKDTQQRRSQARSSSSSDCTNPTGMDAEGNRSAWLIRQAGQPALLQDGKPGPSVTPLIAGLFLTPTPPTSFPCSSFLSTVY